jgi:murein tripeptide amidase MpaA
VSYLNVVEIETAIGNLAAAYPSLTQLITLPLVTFGGKTSHALRIGAGAPGSRDAVMIIGGQHAREWGSPDIVVSFAADLLEAYDTGAGLAYGGKSFTAADVQAIVDTLHIVLFPQVNPDGRERSLAQDSVGGSAGWRPNVNPGNPPRPCAGVDLNRNYDFLFDFNTKCHPDAPLVVSDDPCTPQQTYHGPAAFSEVETQNVRWLLDAFPRTRLFMDLHSFSQLVLYSWGDDHNQSTDPGMNFRNPGYDGMRSLVFSDTTYKEYIPAGDELVAHTLAVRMRDAIAAVRGKTYTAQPAVALYPTTGSSSDYVYARHRENPAKGRIYGFTIEWGTQFRPPWTEMALIVQDISAALLELCRLAPCGAGLTAVTLDTPTLQFIDIPEGDETSRAAVFTVQSCSAVTLQVQSGPAVISGPGAFTLPFGGVVSLPAASSAAPRESRIWVSFTGTSPGDVTTGSVTIRCVETGQVFVIPISANSIAQPRIASVLVLDRSGSMLDPSGIPGKRRLDVLNDSAPIYVNLLPDNHGIGVVSFDQDPHPVKPVLQADAGGRSEANIGIAGHMPTGPSALTAIGDGVELAHNTLAPLAGYDSKATVVFTDGHETAAKYISDVSALVNERVFALGLGTADQLNPVALNALVNSTDGYLLLTGNLAAHDDLRLEKYFSQIQAGVSNAEVVVDPSGSLPPGIDVRIPFLLTETDRSAIVFLLSPAPWAIEFRLETPNGIIIDPAQAAVLPGVDMVTNNRVDQYRMSLPVPVGDGARQGQWHALLSIRKDRYRKYLSSLDQGGLGAAVHGVPYSLNVHAFSSLRMKAWVAQQSYQPGAKLVLRAALTESGLPVEKRAYVQADVQKPDGSSSTLALTEVEPGVFESTLVAVQTGIYPIRFRARGTTLRGHPFTREQLRTTAVWRTGDAPPPSGTTQPPVGADWCGLIACLLSDKGIVTLLERNGIDVDGLRRCWREQCHDTIPSPEIRQILSSPELLRELLRHVERGIA